MCQVLKYGLQISSQEVSNFMHNEMSFDGNHFFAHFTRSG